MAEATIATGIDQSGVGEGAIIFDNTETLKSLQDNLNSLDKAQEERVKQRNLAIANNQKFLHALNPNLNGIFPGDKDAILAETQKLQDMGVAHLKAGRNPESQAAVNQQQENVAALVEVSKARNKALIAANEIYNKKPDDFDAGAHTLATAKLMGVPLNKLSQNPAEYMSGLLQTKPADIDLVLDDFVKKSGTKTITTRIERPEGAGPNEIWTEKVTANMNPAQVSDLSQNYRKYPAVLKAANYSWNQIEPAVRKSLAQPYIENAGMAPAQAEQKAQDDWMNGKVQLHAAYSKEANFHGLNEQGRLEIMRQRESMSEDKNILFGPAMMYSKILAGEPNAYLALMGQPVAGGTYKQVVLKEDGTPEVDAQGNKVYQVKPNVFTDFKYLPDGSMAVRTSEIDDANAAVNYQFQQSPSDIIENQGMPKVTAAPKPAIFQKNQAREFMTFADQNKTGQDLNNMDKAFRKLGAIDATGAYNVDAYKDKYSVLWGGADTQPAKKQDVKKATTTEKTYSIKGKSYPESKVAEKAKASGMSVDEYIKALNQ